MLIALRLEICPHRYRDWKIYNLKFEDLGFEDLKIWNLKFEDLNVLKIRDLSLLIYT